MRKPCHRDDKYHCKGSLTDLLFFDRLLTQQEILWLALNPQYPVKNYTLADWSISPDNPDNVLANATPKYLGVVETQPSTRTATIIKGERLGNVDANPGDWVLSGKTTGEWKVGVCYRWSGLAWKPLEPEVNYSEAYQACLLHMFQIEELKQQTGHYGALFANMLIAQEAFITKLSGDIAFLKQLVVKKLHIDSVDGTHQDFEAWFDELNGLKICNGDEEVFKVSPEGIMQIADKLFFYLIKYSEIGNVVYFNSTNETCKSVFERYGATSKKAYGYFQNDKIHKITIQKTKGKNINYYCFVHIDDGHTASGFWYRMTTQEEKYIVTFFGQNKTYTYTRINTPQNIQYPPDGTDIPGRGQLRYDEHMANKCKADRRIYKTEGTGGYT